jgi:hypothetical protein
MRKFATSGTADGGEMICCLSEILDLSAQLLSKSGIQVQ